MKPSPAPASNSHRARHSLCFPAGQSGWLRTGLALSLALLICACTQAPAPEAPRSVAAPLSIAGAWEKNYGLSDSFDEKLGFVFYDLRRYAAADANRTQNISGSFNALLALAQLADEITRGSTLLISQADGNVRVDREDDFALVCNFNEYNLVMQHGQYGSEVCGWQADRLVFHMTLPDGLSIQHRITLSPDRMQLNVTTTLNSRYVPTGFSLSHYYDRFQRPVDPYDCIQTLSQHQVCTRSGSTLLP